MPELNCVLSSGLWNHLQEYSQRTNQPVAHIVSKALADLFEIPYHTMFQVSTVTALVEGIFQGAVRVATLREHGDLGLGTFEGLDGEMVIVDGHYTHEDPPTVQKVHDCYYQTLGNNGGRQTQTGLRFNVLISAFKWHQFIVTEKKETKNHGYLASKRRWSSC